MISEEKNILNEAIESLGLSVSNIKVEKLLKYLDFVWQYNKKINIVGTREREGILRKHILDSLALLKFREEIIGSPGGKVRILDIGTGAGFPGLVLSIILDKYRFYLLDSNKKKIDFLDFVLGNLNIQNVLTINNRAELAARDESYRESFDIVLTRAVTRFDILLELSIPFCKINGKIIFYKSIKIFEEIGRNSYKIKLLGGRVESLRRVEVPDIGCYRTFLIIEKLKNTADKYPRNFAKIKKKPL